MHPKYTNVKYVFLYIKIYEKHDFKGSRAKLAPYTLFLYTVVLLKSAIYGRQSRLLGALFRKDAIVKTYLSPPLFSA